MPRGSRDLYDEVEAYYRHNSAAARQILSTIARLSDEVRKGNAGRPVRIMNFCGTHEWTTTHYGIRSLIPKGVELISGPGCPVCVTPASYVDLCIKLSLEGVRVYTYGDAFKLPTTRRVKGARSLEEAKSLGGDVAVVYSFLDAMKDAKSSSKKGVFLGIGFETTMPSYSEPIDRKVVPKNLFLLSALRLTPPAATFALEKVGKVDGVIAPGHVSVITGASAWAAIADELHIPTVISGFEPIDVLISIAGLLRQMANGEHKVEIEYKRAVSWKGNERAMSTMHRVFETVDSAWRGIGIIPRSGLELREEHSAQDAKKEFGLAEEEADSWRDDLPKRCRCGEVTLGLIKPTECSLFLRACNPERPYGPCMVSSEGTCAVWARYGGGGLADRVAAEVGVNL
jgi:hydrogenase expression/formation protein HypD